MTVMTRAFRGFMFCSFGHVPWLCLSVRTSLHGRCSSQVHAGCWWCFSWGGCWLGGLDLDDGEHWRCQHPSPSGSPGPPVRSSCCHGGAMRRAGGSVTSSAADPWTFCSTVSTATLLDVTSASVPISVLLLLVVESARKNQANPLVMRGWWATFLTSQASASLWTPMVWNLLYDFVPTIVLLLLVVKVIRKDRGNPLVMRGWWATLLTFQVLAFTGSPMAWVLGLSWRRGSDVDLDYHKALSRCLGGTGRWRQRSGYLDFLGFVFYTATRWTLGTTVTAACVRGHHLLQGLLMVFGLGLATTAPGCQRCGYLDFFGLRSSTTTFWTLCATAATAWVDVDYYKASTRCSSWAGRRRLLCRLRSGYLDFLGFECSTTTCWTLGTTVTTTLVFVDFVDYKAL